MSNTWDTIASTWATETAQWNAFPTDYTYSGTTGTIFGFSNGVTITYALDGTINGVFGIAGIATQNNEALYTGSIAIVFGIAMGDFDLLTWTPETTSSSSWTEEAAL